MRDMSTEKERLATLREYQTTRHLPKAATRVDVGPPPRRALSKPPKSDSGLDARDEALFRDIVGSVQCRQEELRGLEDSLVALDAQGVSGAENMCKVNLERLGVQAGLKRDLADLDKMIKLTDK
mmetsp:Transcript_57677/g.133137  ORF Transcript_57677/g.133137 Transcript_57677/m.133137 type:complete len:124 (-) Transcript_57677:904-1275(-)